MIRLCVAIFLLSPILLNAQQTELRMQEIKQLRAAGEYFTAIDALTELLLLDENNVEAIYALAESYRLTFQYDRALAQYRKVFYLDDNPDPLCEYYLGLMLKYTGNYNESIQVLDDFINRWEPAGRYPDIVLQAKVDRAGSEMALTFKGLEKFDAHLMPSPVNTEYNDYAPVPLHDSLLLITSSRLSNKRQRIEQRYGEAFSDHYLFTYSGGGDHQLNKLTEVLNTRSNDGSGAFSSVTDTYYFSVCGYKVPNCRIYASSWSEEGFSEPELLPEQINYPGADTKQPGVTHSGDTLFFVSDRPGGHGMSDIWMSVRSGSGWGPAMNLGSTVNTALKEQSPYPVLGNMLIFSSDGHQGFGGMDLFLARRRTSGDSILVNFGIPFNTSRDEMFPSLARTKMYWASNQPGGTGGFDIYQADIQSHLYLTSLVTALGRDASRKNALGNSAELPDQGSSIAAIVNTGEIDFTNLSSETQQQIDRIALGKAEKAPSGLSDAQVEVLVAERKEALEQLDKRKTQVHFDVAQSPGHYQVTGTLECYQCDLPPTIYLSGNDGERRQLTIADSTGQFRFSHLNSEEDIQIEIDSSFSGVATLRDIKVRFIPDYRKFSLSPVYFNLAESQVRPESYTILQEIAGFLNNNPDYQLEIIAHADNTGSEDYNLLLTRERGQAVFDALLRSGVSPVSMMIRARGSGEPAAENSSPLGRQLNRRVEFVVSGTGNDPDFSLGFCFTKLPMTGTQLMDHLPDRIINLNGLEGDMRYRSYMPVVVPGDIDPDPNFLDCSNHQGK